jgi:GntR family transcriptional regulator
MQAPAFSPLYMQIKALILKGLEAGEWKPGDMIPSEIELAKRYQVSQGTVRKALDALTAEKHFMRRQGRGTFVSTHAEPQTQFRFIKLVPDTVLSGATCKPPEANTTQRQILFFKPLQAPKRIAAQLQIKTLMQVFQIRRVLTLDQKPTVLEDIWLPAATFKGMSLELLCSAQGSMYELFESKFSVRMVHAVEQIKAVLADPEQARLLEVDDQTPLLRVLRTAYTYQSLPMEFSECHYLTIRHHYLNVLK